MIGMTDERYEEPDYSYFDNPIEIPGHDDLPDEEEIMKELWDQYIEEEREFEEAAAQWEEEQKQHKISDKVTPEN